MNGKEIEKIVRSVVKKVYQMYPDVEWEDLEGQAWLIVSEQIGGYDKDKGASLSTYLYTQVQGRLQEYISRVVLKEYNMRGLRVHGEAECATADIQDKVLAKCTIESILRDSEGVSRDILLRMIDGSTQNEVADELGISKQAVNQTLRRLRRRYNV